MKRIFTILALAVMPLSACDQLQQIVAEGIVLVNEDDSRQVFGWEGGRTEIAIAAIEDWTATSDSKWCIVTPAKGTYEDTDIKILVDKNKTSEERSAVVTLKTASTTLEISVTQPQKPEPEEDEEQKEEEGDQNGEETEDNEEIENGDDTASQPSETFLFMITHEAENFQMPIIAGNFTGLILWGDGKEDAYAPAVTSHTYVKADERTVIMQLDGKSEEFKVEFANLEDIVKIDLSAL